MFEASRQLLKDGDVSKGTPTSLFQTKLYVIREYHGHWAISPWSREYNILHQGQLLLEWHGTPHQRFCGKMPNKNKNKTLIKQNFINLYYNQNICIYNAR